ncbi:TPA: hypothetical protein U1C79_001831 [Streptococcus suis]|nr:hypothetical protein [Streptococcus suis]HEM4285543.1 hypothetical protein [Streptococcus suis]HEM5271372.1 hypothetical protein [Streptococcus suis]
MVASKLNWSIVKTSRRCLRRKIEKTIPPAYNAIAVESFLGTLVPLKTSKIRYVTRNGGIHIANSGIKSLIQAMLVKLLRAYLSTV